MVFVVIARHRERRILECDKAGPARCNKTEVGVHGSESFQGVASAVAGRNNVHDDSASKDQREGGVMSMSVARMFRNREQARCPSDQVHAGWHGTPARAAAAISPITTPSWPALQHPSTPQLRLAVSCRHLV